MFNKLVAESFTVLAVTGAHFRAAAKFVDQHRLGLRAGDALHLATASEHGATVHALDHRLAEAGAIHDIDTWRVFHAATTITEVSSAAR